MYWSKYGCRNLVVSSVEFELEENGVAKAKVIKKKDSVILSGYGSRLNQNLELLSILQLLLRAVQLTVATEIFGNMRNLFTQPSWIYTLNADITGNFCDYNSIISVHFSREISKFLVLRKTTGMRFQTQESQQFFLVDEPRAQNSLWRSKRLLLAIILNFLAIAIVAMVFIFWPT